MTKVCRNQYRGSRSGKRKIFFLSFLLYTAYSLLYTPLATALSSTNFKINDYGFGAGGTAESTSSSYKLNGIVGEVENGRPTSSSYKLGGGLTYEQQANVPGAPTVTNPSNAYYDRLKFVINTSSNPSDTTYALQISTDSTFATNINYIKSDLTMGTSLTSSDFLTYTSWGGASGGLVTGLKPATTYYIRVK